MLRMVFIRMIIIILFSFLLILVSFLECYSIVYYNKNYYYNKKLNTELIKLKIRFYSRYFFKYLKQILEQQKHIEKYRFVSELNKCINKIIKMDLRSYSYLSEDDLNKILRNTPFRNMGGVFKKAEEIYNINAAFLIAVCFLESGYGKSKISKTKYNLFGLKAYNRNPFKYAMSFESYEDCIMFAAQYLSNEYLSESGRYFKGYTVKDINCFYSSDKKWYLKVANLMKRIYNNVY